MARKKYFYGPLHHEIEKEQKMFHYRKKFYADSKDFGAFENVNTDITTRVQIVLNEQFPENEYPTHSLKRYLAVLSYLGNSKNNRSFITFDEKIIFLIQAIDPDLSIYFYFLRNGYSQNAPGEYQKASYLITFIERVVGCLDVQFLKYEEIYFQRFLKCRDIVSHVNRDYSSAFFESFKEVKSFGDINDEVYQLLLVKVADFNASCADPHNVNTVCFNMNNPNSILEIWHPLYKIIFFILVVDPDLNALKIYTEESNMVNIRSRMIEELGFFHEDFIKVEELYRRKFMPDYRASDWAL